VWIRAICLWLKVHVAKITADRIQQQYMVISTLALLSFLADMQGSG